MLKRYAMAVVGAALLLLGQTAAAQQPLRAPYDLSSLTGLVSRPFVPVEIHRLDGPDALEPNQPGRFIAHANVDVATLPFRSRWDFGDGTSARGLAVRHSYAEPGTYRVVFTLWNEGSTAADTLTVSVGPPTDIGSTAHAVRLERRTGILPPHAGGWASFVAAPALPGLTRRPR